VAYDEELADRIRRVLAARRDVTERAMFGGLAFMARGHMACGLVGDTLMVRVGPDGDEALLEEPHVRPMDFTGRPLTGFLYVDGPGIETPAALRRWVERATRFVDGLPEKKTARKRETRKAPRRARKR
jgi:TfoX/Sxy family transcriptional regulator of competence genes